MVKSIPHSCRMAFSHALATALGKVAATPTSIEAWVKLLLLPRYTLRVFRVSNRQERRVVLGKDDHVFGSDSSNVGTNVKQCLRKVSDGHFTAAVKVLCSSRVAPFDTDSLTAFVLECIQSFLKGTSCGPDGLRAQHILDALCGEGSAIAVGLLKAIFVVVNLLLEGKCPKVLAGFMASAPLMPLLKPDNRIWPIVFGVGVPSGAEAVLHGTNRFLNKFHSDGSLAMLTVDFSNAFNLVDRTTLLHKVRTRCLSISLWVDFLYGQSARLYVGDDHIWSTTEVQQGDPLGPLLFALVLHPLVHRIKDCCQLLFHAWYLDDDTIIGDTKEVAKAIDIIKAEGPLLGLELNIKKTEVFWPSSNGVKVKDGLFPRDIGRSTLGVKLLRGADNILQGCGIDGADSDYRYALDRIRVSLPEFDLSGFSNKDTPKAKNFLACALFSEIVKSLGVSFDLSPRQKAMVECLRAPYAQNFLTVVPIEGLGQHMSALEYRTILKDVLCDVLKRAEISSKKEAPVNFLTDALEGRSTLRPADILVFGWAGRKYACVDLTGVSPLVGLRDNGFVVGQAALKAESSKVAKHKKACLENQHVFIPFTFDTFGFLAPEADEFLIRVQRVVQTCKSIVYNVRDNI
nr:putative reverse transcriptase domain-containing protein [Tanacetum cinerariifolium]